VARTRFLFPLWLCAKYCLSKESGTGFLCCRYPELEFLERGNENGYSGRGDGDEELFWEWFEESPHVKRREEMEMMESWGSGEERRCISRT